MTNVFFAYADQRLAFRYKQTLKTFISEIFLIEKRSLTQLQYVFCSDEYLLTINQDFLKHNTFTDIITFDLSSGPAVSGEIYVSGARVKDNARHFGVNFQEELQRVLFHGALHLCGYRDKKKSEIALMRYKEDEYLRLFELWRLNS